MLTLIFNLFLPIIIPSLLLFISFLINLRSYNDREKISPFECGFDPKSTARIPFRLRFFLLAVLFLVFDIEIVLILSSPAIFNLFSLINSILSFTPFILILIFGLMHEWNEGSLEWVN